MATGGTSCWVSGHHPPFHNNKYNNNDGDGDGDDDDGGGNDDDDDDGDLYMI